LVVALGTGTDPLEAPTWRRFSSSYARTKELLNMDLPVNDDFHHVP
jgi:hypothetical protein